MCLGWASLISDRQGSHDLAFDEPGEFLRAGIIPAQVLTAVGAKTMRPRVPGKPGVLHCRKAGLLASDRLGESNYFKMDALGVGK